MKRFFVSVLVVIIVFSLVLVGCVAPATSPTPAQPKAIELIFGHQNPPTARTTVKFIDPWAKKIEELTKGRVKITMFPAETLFKATDAYEATVGGTTDFCWTIMGYWASRFPLSSVMSLPFLSMASGKIDGKVVYGGIVNSHILQELYETLPEIQAEWQDVKVLFLICSNPSVLFTSKKPVRNTNDIKGLKIREQTGYAMDMWKLLGATPLNLGMPDVYEAVTKGVIDGINVSFASANNFKFYEFLKYWTDAGTLSPSQMMIMNLKTWNSLPPDIQKTIMSISGMYGAEWCGEEVHGIGGQEEFLAAAEKAGKPMQRIVPDPGELERWKEVAGRPIWDKWVSELNAKGLNAQKVLDTTLNLLKKHSP